ncbi:contact-dependent growth inhibition system immunity protein [Acinetobacter baumannii]|uniref:contact-dependent growth inhibition system immunity protein n=1 Tax=Acinetobacter baumannii TaxID=470 RepID=UPI00233E63AE|nr:contact-dependent growth inhibition system immunity protein [Acinetobacter baumannii]MDC4727279.1 contact-dependent growth inhibition system immunity protein [Acinetobacter baumannii]MDC5484536.1 contact-dependent growth inhibition system immunity protein [Acinetobacter baumannii]
MIDNFESNFPLMYQLLGAWFSDLDYEDITYQEIVKNYKKVAKSEKIDSLKLEFKEILIKKMIDYKYISQLSNIYFENNEDTLKWLSEIYNYLIED